MNDYNDDPKEPNLPQEEAYVNWLEQNTIS